MDDTDIESLRDTADPLEQARRAGQIIDEHQSKVSELSRIRREALEKLVTAGKTHTEIARELGMTRSRVGQLLSSGPRPERAFLGSGALVCALGGKLEAGKDKPGPVVSDGALAAYERLAALARTLGLDAGYEIIPPPGMVHLNRTNLVVICGPRLSPLIGQVLESDPKLSFARDSEWHLVDRSTGEVHRSPLDDGERGDIAYLARLPRPDGRGTFLYVAGIHAMGAAGAAHFIEDNLPELYREVKTRRFSMLIASRFDAKNQIISSEQITEIYRHESI